MKMTPQLLKAAEKMKAGDISRDGFFGRDERDLAAILDEQHAACLRLGVSYERIAREMRRIGHAGAGGFGAPVEVDGKWSVIVDENRGKIPCPWPHPGVYQKTVYTVENLRTGRSARYSELTIHMIFTHGFFQGEGAPFYNSPATLVDVLEIAPDTED